MEIRSACLRDRCGGIVVFAPEVAPELEGVAGLCTACGSTHRLRWGRATVEPVVVDLRYLESLVAAREPIGRPRRPWSS